MGCWGCRDPCPMTPGDCSKNPDCPCPEGTTRTLVYNQYDAACLACRTAPVTQRGCAASSHGVNMDSVPKTIALLTGKRLYVPRWTFRAKTVLGLHTVPRTTRDFTQHCSPSRDSQLHSMLTAAVFSSSWACDGTVRHAVA